MIDMLAFLHKFAFHVAMDLLLDELGRAGQDVVISYMKAKFEVALSFH